MLKTIDDPALHWIGSVIRFLNGRLPLALTAVSIKRTSKRAPLEKEEKKQTIEKFLELFTLRGEGGSLGGGSQVGKNMDSWLAYDEFEVCAQWLSNKGWRTSRTRAIDGT
ncbi:hypothetical protein TNCV_3867131 [Trichonephila clavipes]|nr:hypothetical protein TNCV_3867131 [Trichonephila clavipes]